MKKKTKIVLLTTAITAGSAILGSSQATPLGSMNASLQTSAHQSLLDQVKSVNVDYTKLELISDPLQTACGVNCSC